MQVIRLTLVVGVLVSARSQFVKAALGFRLGYSPTEHQKVNNYAHYANYGPEKKGVGVQIMSGTNNGGHQAREGPLSAHVGNGAVKHIRILGLNLYLGGRAAQQKATLKKPFHLPHPLSFFGIRPSIHLGAKPSGAPHTVGASTGLRAAVGTHDYGVGFKVGYRQGINTKSPLAQVLQGGDGKYSYVPTAHKGQDQVYLHGNSLLKGHGHNQYGGYGQLDSPVAGLESKHHFSTQPLQQLGSQLQQLQLQGPIRIPYIPQHRTILRPIQYTFPQQVAHPSPHPPHQQQHSRPNNPRWSTIFPANGLQPAASNHFINPLPPNGQPLAQLQANLRGPIGPQHQQPQHQKYQGFPIHGFQLPYAQPSRHQNNFQQHPYPQQSAVQHQFPQEYNLFKPQNLNTPLFFPQQHNQQHPQSQSPQQSQNPQHSQNPQQPQNPQQSHFFSQIQEQPLSLPQIPFTADSMTFQPDPNFQYTGSEQQQSTVSMGSYTIDMSQAPGSENVPVGPLGRRLKKAKRHHRIIKKSDTFDTKDLETSASSNNAILMASSMGATSWTPLVMEDIPKLSKKLLETPAFIPENKEQKAVIKPKPESQHVGVAISVVPTVASSTPVEYSQDRSMILKKRRLNVSGEVTGPTVIPTTTFPTTLPSTTTTTTPSTTSALPLSSSSSSPSSSIAPSSSSSSSTSSSAASEAVSDFTSESSLTTVIV